MYLVDTDVLSAARRLDRSPAVRAWFERHAAADLYLSAITIGEIERGVEGQQRLDAPFAAQLEAWLEKLLQAYGDRVLPVDAPVARAWGRLTRALGHSSADLLIAATAQVHGLAVVTRNLRHFEPTGVPVVDPSRPTA
ncbi:MAG: type II toxin-antitoxin system VapC family toxin [Myxococcales bacterium]|nr:type II toxin-antitoxin system VapC family toxin [Myxococcales bacterium]MCB9536585.1 type II toxin-antitoxin system VapC family toxin [Myxococcales bacterium]